MTRNIINLNRLPMVIAIAMMAIAMYAIPASAKVRTFVPCGVKGVNIKIVQRPKRCEVLGGRYVTATGANIKNLRWSSWGGKTARATGKEYGFHGGGGVKVTIKLMGRLSCDGSGERVKTGSSSAVAQEYSRLRETLNGRTRTLRLPSSCAHYGY
jgi:hypothetical protein